MGHLPLLTSNTARKVPRTYWYLLNIGSAAMKSKQGPQEDQPQRKDPYGFADPVDTKKGYYVTGADITEKRHTLRVFIKCRDRDVLDTYLGKLKISLDLQALRQTIAQLADASAPLEAHK